MTILCTVPYPIIYKIKFNAFFQGITVQRYNFINSFFLIYQMTEHNGFRLHAFE